ncbi:Maleylacetoacetate isomerase /Glutathione S-transferase, zeta (plasmid) [Pseudomonas sp. XWY-1]|uniref:maleylacetoacetate isomerase n=1 Tax=unclassified Pseudomonas TaxID=196821 RepID=UPI00057D258C|nr:MULTISPECIES: maleylacetoacetate isomerase [unclassified Pseudomonas]AMK37615.1 maleyl pyruvate isomerase [Pseudomonas sp. C5pp]AUZ62240.1 Maleylacetoacetate isomerase /Glutathione S-transferase, zeta [Pseudomonas sp. XWY-1]KIC79533.1 maleylacetoacetate isomerase [Pseudomonas sp. C5pp]
MQLYSFFNSSTSYRVRIALALKGLAYDCLGVNLRSGEQLSTAHRELNPAAGVPVLVTDDSQLITQSLAIIDYLDALQPAPRLLPAEPLARARVLEIANLIACDIHPINNLRVLNYLQRELGVSAGQKDAWYRHWVAEGLAAVESLLQRHGQGPYCFGAAPTLADCCLVPQVANAQRMGCELEDYPQLMAVYRNCLEQPAFQAAAPARQPDFIA